MDKFRRTVENTEHIIVAICVAVTSIIKVILLIHP